MRTEVILSPGPEKKWQTELCHSLRLAHLLKPKPVTQLRIKMSHMKS